jgi:hypothetical protein
MKAESNMVSLITWLDFLRSVVPPSGVVVVGAGFGSGPFIQLIIEWNQTNALLFEGNIAQFKHLQRNIGQQKTLQLHNCVVVPYEGCFTFHHASNPAESGLIDPAHLHALWPFLHTLQSFNDPNLVTLSRLLSESGSTYNWLVIDCLPAGELLFSIEDKLQQLDILVIRVVLDKPDSFITAIQQGKGYHAALEPWLETQGFRCLVVKPERHPLIAHAVYVRDTGKQKAAFTQKHIENSSLYAENAALKQERDMLCEVVVTLKKEIEKLEERRLDDEKQFAHLKNEMFSLQKNQQ